MPELRRPRLGVDGDGHASSISDGAASGRGELDSLSCLVSPSNAVLTLREQTGGLASARKRSLTGWEDMARMWGRAWVKGWRGRERLRSELYTRVEVISLDDFEAEVASIPERKRSPLGISCLRPLPPCPTPPSPDPPLVSVPQTQKGGPVGSRSCLSEPASD